MTIKEKKQLIFEKAAEALTDCFNDKDKAMIAAGMGYMLKDDMSPRNFYWFILDLPNFMELNARYGMPIDSFAYYFNEFFSDYLELSGDSITLKSHSI